MTDCQLLIKFQAMKDESALEELVKRHSSMVMGTCLRILKNPHDAQDAFQASFLILLQKANSLTKRENIGGWLYQVACFTANNLKRKVITRSKHENQQEDVAMLEQPALEVDQTWNEISPILDQELSQLSEKYRLPIVYCYLEGKSYEETARFLGVPHSTIRMRLEHGREMLKNRLAKKGVTISVGILGTCLAEKASAAVSPMVIQSTVQTAMSTLAGKATVAEAASEPLLNLTQEVIRSMLMKKIQITALSVFLILLATGSFLMIYDFQNHTQRSFSATKILDSKFQIFKSSTSIPVEHLTKADFPFVAEQALKKMIASRKKGFKAFQEARKEFENTIRQWIDLDVETALDWAQKQVQTPEALYTVVKFWGARDVSKAIEWAQQLPIGRLKDTSLSGATQAWAQIDPFSAAKWVEQLPHGLQDAAAAGLLEGWMEKDPNAAKSWLESLSENKIFNSGMIGMAKAMALKDPVAAIQWAQNLPEGKTRDLAIEGVAETWAWGDPAAATQWAQQVNGKKPRDIALSNVASGWAEFDPMAAIQWAQQIPDENDRLSVLYGALYGWTLNDPTAAANWISHLSGKDQTAALIGLTASWAYNDPVATFNWIQKMSLSEEGFQNAIYGLASGWTSYDQDAAVQWALQLPKGDIRDNVLRGFGKAWGSNDPDAAIKWLQQITEGRDRDNVIVGLAFSLTQSDPEGAVKWATGLPEGKNRNDAVMQVAINWAAYDVSTTLDWALQLPNGEMHNFAIAGVAIGWASQDATAAKNWAMQVSGNDRYFAIGGVANGYWGKDPTATKNWALQLPAGSDQNAAIHGLVASWSCSDPVAAKTWLQQSSLPEKTKSLILNRVGLK